MPRNTISVGEARKLLGKDARTLSDGEIEELISLLRDIARSFLKKQVPENSRD